MALVGLSGTGKSSVARLLARRRGWRLVDLDAAVQELSGQGIAELFATEGEAGFRRREAEALTAALAVPGPLVLACGGGVVTDPALRAQLSRECTVVWLDASDAELLARLGAVSDRPLLAADPAGRLAAQRAARQLLYAEVADLRIDVGGSDVDDITDRVEDAVSGERLGVPGAPRLHASAETLRMDLGARSYPIVVGAGVIDQLGGALPLPARRVAVVADRAVLGMARAALGQVRGTGRWGKIVSLRGGERVKTWARAGRLVEDLARLRLGRGDCLVAVGGGTVGDVAGFAAASYLRGIAVIHVPTTLLAMVDSAVGGKTGVNLAAGKNLAGAFWQPAAVLCDLDALRTVPARAHRAAFAEIVKYAMVADDAELTGLLDGRLDALLDRDPQTLALAVRRCCALKAAVVSADEREAGQRAILNYGHTAGHAIEAVAGLGEVLHGEAVAMGMRVAGRLSVRANGCPNADVTWQDDLLRRCGLGGGRQGSPNIDPALTFQRTLRDKKASGGVGRWVLLERRGHASPGHELGDALVLAALAEVLAP